MIELRGKIRDVENIGLKIDPLTLDCSFMLVSDVILIRIKFNTHIGRDVLKILRMEECEFENKKK